MNGYVCIYKGKQIEVYAASSYEAQQKANEVFKARKPYQIDVYLAEKQGKPVVQTLT